MNLRVDVLESLIWPAAYYTKPPWIVNHLHLLTREAEKRIRSPWAMLLLALSPILVQCAATLLWNRTLDWIGRSKWPSGWSIPVTGVSNGEGGMLTPPPLCRQWTAAVFLGLTNTCWNRNGWLDLLWWEGGRGTPPPKSTGRNLFKSCQDFINDSVFSVELSDQGYTSLPIWQQLWITWTVENAL